MFNLMLDYALEYELVDKNYAWTFDLSNDIIKEKEAATRGHIIFTDKEMQTLWDHVDSLRFADWILIQCYMGRRPISANLSGNATIYIKKCCVLAMQMLDSAEG